MYEQGTAKSFLPSLHMSRELQSPISHHYVWAGNCKFLFPINRYEQEPVKSYLRFSINVDVQYKIVSLTLKVLTWGLNITNMGFASEYVNLISKYKTPALYNHWVLISINLYISQSKIKWVSYSDLWSLSIWLPHVACPGHYSKLSAYCHFI